MNDDIKDLSLSEILSKFVRSISSRKERNCNALSDYDFILLCLKRIALKCQSGRDFLQFLADLNIIEIARSTFFSAFHSKRRKEAVSDIANKFYSSMKTRLSTSINYLQDFPELEKYEVLSADGHFIQHASHTEQNENGKVCEAGGIYMQDLRTGLVRYLETVRDGTRKTHEMKVFKEVIAADKNTQKVIYVLDKGFINNALWVRMCVKNKYIISRIKKSHKITKISELSFDKTDNVNTGIINDYLANFSDSGRMVRIIEYVDPETNKSYNFFTTLLDAKIRPGIIAYLYFLRWQIEKVFDVFKNGFLETKAWGPKEYPITIQNCAISIYHNFLIFLQEYIKNKTKITKDKTQKKYEKHLEQRKKIAEKQNLKIHPLIGSYFNRFRRFSLQFIRIVRNCFHLKKSLNSLIELFYQRLIRYL